MSTVLRKPSEKDTPEYYIQGHNRNQARSCYYTDEVEEQINLLRNKGFGRSKKQWIEEAIIEKILRERKEHDIRD